jgi:DNA-binding IclR family transcriptional regulator
LEYFNIKRGEATVMEVARALGYPQSSTSELLNCLVEEGYLHRNRYLRTYRPMARVVALGAWVQPELFRSGGLLALMDTLAETTRCSISLGTVVGVKVQQLHAIEHPECEPCAFDDGSLLHTALGKVLLSNFDFTTIRKMIHRVNANAEGQYPLVQREALMLEVEQIQRRGFAADHNTAAIQLPQHLPDEPLALAITLSPEAEHQDLEVWANVLRDAVMQHFAPEPRSANPPPAPVLARREVKRLTEYSRDWMPRPMQAMRA